MKTRIGIVGAGAIGCVVGGLLAKAGEDVTLIDQWPEHVEAIRRRGLRLGGTCGDHTVSVTALHVHEERGHRGHCSHDAEGPAVHAAESECAICELLAVKVPGIEPEAPPTVEPAQPATDVDARDVVASPRPLDFWVVCGPRGPPVPPPA